MKFQHQLIGFTRIHAALALLRAPNTSAVETCSVPLCNKLFKHCTVSHGVITNVTCVMQRYCALVRDCSSLDGKQGRSVLRNVPRVGTVFTIRDVCFSVCDVL